MIRAIARYVAMFSLLWITPKVRGEFDVLRVDSNGGETRLFLPLNQDTLGHGVQSLFWASRSGHAVVEPAEIEKDGRWFKVLGNYGMQPKATSGAWLSGWLGDRLEHFGNLHYETVKLPNGTLATLTRKSSAFWVIHIHGRKTLVGETLRNFQLFDDLGFNQLSISHETDSKPYGLGAHRSTLGYQEWKELESAVLFAKAEGAERIVLFGWSLGAMIAGQFIKRSAHSSLVMAAVFDSPMFDVRHTLRLQATLSGFETEFADEVCTLIETSKLLRILGYPQLNFDEYSLSAHQIGRILPMLVMYSKDDGYVAFQDAETFAEINNSVRLVEFEGARHCRLMNSYPAKYADTLKMFISELGI